MKVYRKMRKNVEKYIHLFWNPINRFSFLLNDVHCGKNMHAKGKIWIRNYGNNTSINIGDNFTFNSGNWLLHAGGDGLFRLEVYLDGQINIGDNVGMSNILIGCENKISIGNNCTFGYGVQILDTDFHSKEELRGSKSDSIPTMRPVSIGNNVFVGANTLILRGTTIEDGAMISAGSVVAGSHIKANEYWAGNPARRFGILESPQNKSI